MSSHPLSPARKDVRDQVSPPSPLSGPSIPIDGSPEDLILTKNHARGQIQKNLIERDRCQVTIDILPDDILICIFRVYMEVSDRREEWRTLVHVCRRWRILVFGSPHHLNVELFCSIMTPVLAKLDIWPALPIVVYQHYFRKHKLDNLIAAIKHNDRVCKIDFHAFFDKWQLERIVSLMEVPFPALTHLTLTLLEMDGAVPVLSDLFLGGSTPRLQHLELGGFSFPGLPHLLLSATGLVSFELRRIPHSWYISPDTMVTHLSALTRLTSLTLEFEFCRSRPDRESRHSPPPTRTLIPALTLLRFKGVHEYAEDLMARIDTPLLRRLCITFFNEPVPKIPHLSQFINRIPKFQALREARVTFSEDEVSATIRTIGYERLVLGIVWDESVGQLSSLARFCGLLLPTLAVVEQLYIYGDVSLRPLDWSDGIRRSHWLELLHLFTGAKNLYLAEDLTPYISPVLEQLVGKRAAEVLPALQNVFLNGYPRKSIRQGFDMFVTEREFSGHPISVCWSV